MVMRRGEGEYVGMLMFLEETGAIKPLIDVCLFVCWYKTRKTILRLLFLEGSKTPGNDRTLTQALLRA